MKKLLRKRFMFLVALLVSLCMPMMAQTTSTTDNLLNIAGLEPVADGQTMYYLKNVGTGLMLSHGGQWGTFAVESQSAHPIIVEKNEDNLTYALGSLGGYLGANLFMDRPKSESKWILKPVDGYDGQYYIQMGEGEDASLLSSVGNRVGQLTAKANEGKALQRWVFIDGGYVRDVMMPKVTEESPIDVSMAIRAGAFDYVDAWKPKVENGVPYTSSVFYEMMGDEHATDNNGDEIVNYHGYRAEHWTGYLDFKYGAHSGNPGGWNEEAAKYNFCCIINKHGRNNASDIATYTMTLPAGVYRLQYDAFYKSVLTKTVWQQKRTRSRYGNWSDWSDDNSVTPTTTIDSEATLDFSVSIDGLGLSQVITGAIPQNTSVIFDDGVSAADEFRNAKNLAAGDEGYQIRYGTFENDMVFFLKTRSDVTITVRDKATKIDIKRNVEKENSAEKYSQTRMVANYIYDYQVYLDNFCLYYSGMPSDAPKEVTAPYDAKEAGNEELLMTVFWYDYPDVVWGSLWEVEWWINRSEENKEIYEEWIATHDFYFSEVPREGYWGYDDDDLEELSMTKDEYDAAKKAYDEYSKQATAYETEMASRFENADKNMIFKNYLEANFADYLELLGNAGDAVFLEMMSEWIITESDGSVSVNKDKVTSRVKYYDAIELMEEAFAQAKIADLKANISANGNDFTGLIVNHSFEEGLIAGQGSTLGWTVGETSSPDVRVASRTYNNGSYVTEGMHESHLFNNWWHGSPITQKVSMPNADNGSPQNLRNGTYLLSALVTSDPDAVIYLTAQPNNADLVKRGLVTGGAGIFDDYGMRVDLQDARDLTIGVVGGDDLNDYVYKAEGGKWYKCDNFRLEFLPNGTLPLKDEDVKIKNIIDPFVGVNVTRSISSDKWSTLVLPFDMPKPSDWEIETLTEVSQYNGDIKLVFGKPNPEDDEGDGSVLMKAGVPYIVRVKNNVNAIEASDVNVNTTLKIPGLKESGEYTVEFVPVYEQGYVPASAIEKDADGNPVLGEDGNAIAAVGPQYYFLSGGKLKRCIYENSNKIKGFRGYFKVTPKTTAAARALRSMSMQTSEETDIENVATEEVKVIGIYDVNGIRLSEMKPGINILRMNNGTTKKVMVK